MLFPRKVTYSLLSLILVITVLFRYPLEVGHILGSDSTFIVSLTDSIIELNRAAWIIHPTSYLGLYALSYPSAMPFILADAKFLGGVPIEGAALLVGLVFSAMGTMGAFAASRAARADDRLALIVALLFAISPFLVKDTQWVASSRGYVTSMVPILFLLLFRHMRTRDVRIIAVLVVLVFTMTAIHRMGALAIFVLVAYAFSLPFHRVTQQLRFALIRYEAPFRLASLAIAVSSFFVLFYLQFQFPGLGGVDVVQEFGSGAFFSGSSFPALVGNMGVSLVGKVGLLFPLAIVGLIRFTWQRPKEDRDKFILSAVFVIIPLLAFRDYVSEFLIYLFVFLIALSLFPRRALGQRKKVVVFLLVVGLVMSSFVFGWVVKDYWREHYYTDGPISDELYSDSLYFTWSANGTLLSNEGLSAGRIAAVSGRPVLPIGGASIHWFGPQQLTFGFVNPRSVAVRSIPWTSISFQTDEIFAPLNVPNAKDDYETMFYNPLGDAGATQLMDQYGVHYVFVLNSHSAEFQSYLWRPSPMVQDTTMSRYKTFESDLYSIWFLG